MIGAIVVFIVWSVGCFCIGYVRGWMAAIHESPDCNPPPPTSAKESEP